MKCYFYFILFFQILFSQSSQDIIYIKYFGSDFNFKSDLSMLSTDRRGKAHLAVSYNSINQPIKIERVSAPFEKHMFFIIHFSLFMFG